MLPAGRRALSFDVMTDEICVVREERQQLWLETASLEPGKKPVRQIEGVCNANENQAGRLFQRPFENVVEQVDVEFQEMIDLVKRNNVGAISLHKNIPERIHLLSFHNLGDVDEFFQQRPVQIARILDTHAIDVACFDGFLGRNRTADIVDEGALASAGRA